MINETAAPTASPAADRCAECQARLAHDQRYCMECGARRGPLPAQIGGLIGAFLEQRPRPPHPASLPPGTPLAESILDPAPAPRGPQMTMPGPRAAAAAVMGMLGFGVIVGSLVGGTSLATLASAPLIVVGLGHTTPRAATVQSAAGSEVSGGGGGSGGGAAAAAPAATAQASASPSTSPTSASGERHRHGHGHIIRDRVRRPSAGQARVPDRSVGPTLHQVVRRRGARRLPRRRAAPAGRADLQLLRGGGSAPGQRDRADQRAGPDRPDRLRLSGVLPHQTRPQGSSRPDPGHGVRLSRRHPDAGRPADQRRRQLEGLPRGGQQELDDRMQDPEARQQGAADGPHRAPAISHGATRSCTSAR